MKYAVDLHIHSALSPCSSNEMTPNNIINMAFLKKLDIIAVTDHNSVENLPAIESCAKKRDILLVPGMELETSEEIHVLCYLPDIEKAFELQKIVYASLPKIKNRTDIFGDQYVMDSMDEITGICERMLVTACSIPVHEVFRLADELGGVAVPAHINRSSYSILSNLGYIPDDLMVTTVEMDLKDSSPIRKGDSSLHKYKIIHSSDSHSLDKIFETQNTSDRFFYMNLANKSTSSVIKYLKSIP